MSKLVSILIPAYNCQRWISETLESAIKQSWAECEVIVVDDGSTDGTLTVARSFEGERVLVASQPNGGAAAARNKALSLAQGDYIQWLDADDLLGPNKIELQMKAVLRHGPRALYSSAWGYFRHRPWKAQFTPTPLWESQDPIEWLTRKWEHNAHMQTATWLTSRELAEEAGPWDTTLLNDDDGEYFFRVINRCEKIEFVPEAKVFYRIVQSPRLSFIGRDQRKQEAQCRGMVAQVEALLQVRDTPRIREACLTYLKTWQHHFYPDRPDLREKLQILARRLGAELPEPRMARKYELLRKLIGWRAAESSALKYNRLKSTILDRWDQWAYERSMVKDSRPQAPSRAGGTTLPKVS